MARIVPTPSQLAAAFAAARLPTWPADLQAALSDPLVGRLVHMHAVRLAMGFDDYAGHRTVHRPEVHAPEPPHSADALAPRQAPRQARHPRREPANTQLPLVDRKRAASGDTD